MSLLSNYLDQNLSALTYTAQSWVVLSPIEQRIKEKIEKVGKPLKDWDIQINYGIKTGFNEAFIIDGAKRKELIEKSPKSEEIIRPILRGRDIKRYGYEFADLYIIATFPSKHYNIDDYPAIKEHLLSFGYDRLKQTGEKGARKKTNNQWFETQDSISYWEDFYRHKIIYPGLMRIAKSNMQNFPRFCYDLDENFFFGNDCYFIVGESLLYLWGFLNSNFIGYLFRYYIYSFDETGYKVFTDYFKNIPIPDIKNKEFLSELSKKIIANNLTKDKKELNKLVYEICNLTEIEIDYIESVIS